jgi:hypothetical protein
MSTRKCWNWFGPMQVNQSLLETKTEVLGSKMEVQVPKMEVLESKMEAQEPKKVEILRPNMEALVL